MQLFLEQLLNGIAMGSIYALVTLGLALVYGILRILHVAHAAVYTVGAYAGLFCYSQTGSLLAAFLGGMVFCSVLGVAIERLVYYPLLKFPPYVPLIGSIAVMLSIEEICRLVAGPYILTFPARLPFPEFHLGGVTVSSTLTATMCALVGSPVWTLGLRSPLRGMSSPGSTAQTRRRTLPAAVNLSALDNRFITTRTSASRSA